MVVDIAFIHQFCGNHLAEVSCNGQLRDTNINKLLKNAARIKVVLCRQSEAHTTCSSPRLPGADYD